MIDAMAPLSITHQCELLAISRAVHYRFRSPRSADTGIMLKQTLTSLSERHPYYGSRRLQLVLANTGWQVGIRRIPRLMRGLGLSPLRPQPRTSVPDEAHMTYPYLLRGYAIERDLGGGCHVHSMALTHDYLVDVMDWHSRWVLAWRLPNIRWTPVSAWMPCKTRYRASVSPSSSTPTGDRSSPARCF